MYDLHAYSSDLQGILRNLPWSDIERVIGVLERARTNGRTVFIMGNGGSASTASHFVCDIAKNTRRADLPLIKAVGLADNMALLSAYGNDEGYETVFAQQLANLVRQDDVVIAISTSGESSNVVSAVRLAKRARALTIGLTGLHGGELARIADFTIKVPGSRIEYVEDLHLILEHMITARLREVSPSSEALADDGHLRSDVGRDPRQPPDVERLGVASDPLEFASAAGHNQRPVSDSDILKRLLTLSLESVQAASGSVLFVDGDLATADTGILCYDGQTWETKGENLDLLLSTGLAGWVIRNKMPALVPDTQKDERWFKREWDNGSSRSAISVPLLKGETLLGALTVVYLPQKRLTADDLASVVALAPGLALLASQSMESERAPS